MRKPADWMTTADERILETLFEVPEDRLSMLLHRMENQGVDYHREYVGRRCRKLVENGLLYQENDQGWYSITDLGRGFIAGEVNLQELDLEGGEPIEYQWRDSGEPTDPQRNPADVGLWPAGDVEYECAVCGRSIGSPTIRVSIDVRHDNSHTEWYVGSACRNFLEGALGDR